MKYFVLLFCLVSISAVGCGQSETGTVETPVIDVQTTGHVLCKDCGQAKGTDLCCAEGAEECKCGFVHGSPACCKLEKGDEDIQLCAKCGEVAGGDACCKEGAEVCSGCGLHKGAPGCCIKTEASDDHEGHDHEEGDHDHDGDHDHEDGDHDHEEDAK